MTHATYRFGDCSLRLAAREFRRGGVRVDLSPRLFDCLAYLIAHRDRAIGRDELLAAIWGKTDLGDAALAKAILSVRRAIGDDAERQLFIRTVPRFGYHWVGTIETATDGCVPDGETERPSARRRDRPVRLGIALAAAALLLTAAALVRIGPSKPRAEPIVAADGSATAPTVLVLPVEVEGEADDAWLRLGLMDLVSNRLRDGGLTVAPSDSVVRLLAADVPAAADAGRLLAATDGGITVRAVARREPGGWTVRAAWRDRHDTREHAVEAHAADAISAGRRIADRLLDLHGARPHAALEAQPAPLDELLQRLEAARLGDDLDQARELLAQATPALRGSPEIRMRQAQIDIRAGRFDPAIATLTATLADLPAERRASLRVQALNLLGIATQRTGQLDASVMWFTQAQTLLLSDPQPIFLARVLTGRGGSLALLQRHAEAAEDFANARVQFRLAGDAVSIAWIEANEGTLQMDRGRLDSAVARLQEAAAAFRRAGFLNEEISSAANLTQLHLLRMEPLKALAASDEAMPHGRRLRDGAVLAHFNLWRLHALAANGRLDEARALAQAMTEPQPIPEAALFRSVGHAWLARLDHDQGHAPAAAAAARRAVDGLDGLERYWRLRADAWLSLTRAQRGVDAGRAAGDVRAFAQWAAGPAVPDGLPQVALAEAEQAAAAGNAAAAAAHYETALRQADAMETPAIVAEVAQSYGRFLIDRGDLQRAGTIVARLAAWAPGDYDCAVLQARLYRALGEPGAAFEQAAGWAAALAGERRPPAFLRERAAGAQASVALGNR